MKTRITLAARHSITVRYSIKNALHQSYKQLFKLVIPCLFTTVLASGQAVAQTGADCSSVLSDVGQKVADALEPGNEWMLTACNKVQGPPIDNRGDFLNTVVNEIKSTRSRFALSTLSFSSAVNARYLAPALAEANIRAKLMAEKNATPLFQFLVASDPTQIYQELTQNITGKWYINVVVYQVGTGGNVWLNWNHSKMVIRDETVVYSGSQNMNTLAEFESATDDENYNYQKEVSLGFYGEAAPVALKQFDKLVDVAQDSECSWPTSRKTTCKDLPAYPSALIGVVTETTPVFSLDRGDFGLLTFDFQADKAISAALNAAQHSIDLSQHGYNYLFRTSHRVVEELAQALIRGVEVKSMVAFAWGNSGDPYDQYVDLVYRVHELAIMEGLTDEERFAADCRLQFAVMQTAEGTDAQNHAKYFMVDDKLFYLGSQNLYPGSYWDNDGQDIGGLYEHGFIVDDAAVANMVKQSYWTPKWNFSKPAIMTSPILPADYVCPQSQQKAELAPTPILTSGTLEVGQTVMFDSGVANTGNASSGVFNVKWLVDGQEVGAYGAHGSVSPGETQLDGNSAYSWVVEAGQHTLTFIVDVDNHVDELDETNNAVSTTLVIGDGSACQTGQLCVQTPFETEVWTYDTGPCDGNANDSGTTVNGFIALGPFPEYCYTSTPDSFEFNARACDQSPPLCSLGHSYSWPNMDPLFFELTEADFTTCPAYECQN